jgi:hypothetical protein
MACPDAGVFKNTSAFWKITLPEQLSSPRYSILLRYSPLFMELLCPVTMPSISFQEG